MTTKETVPGSEQKEETEAGGRHINETDALLAMLKKEK